MAFASPFAMPGAFHFERPNLGGVNGVHPEVFRPPPTSPSASSSVYGLAKSTSSLLSESSAANATPAPVSNSKRKRASREPTPLREWTLAEGDEGFVVGGRGSYFDAASPVDGSRAELRYTLAGQIDTPAGAAARAGHENMEDSAYSDIEYRRALGPKKAHPEFDDVSPVHNSNQQFTSSQASQQSSQSTIDGWSRFALDTIGGVVGKVLEFCKTTSFRGFYAGGGKGYSLDGSSQERRTDAVDPADPILDDSIWHDEKSTRVGSTLPGAFPYLGPTSGFAAMPIQSNGYARSTAWKDTPGNDDDTPSRPSAKRRQLSSEIPLPATGRGQAGGGGGDDLRRNWVMVNDPVNSQRQRQQPQLHQQERRATRTPRQSYASASSLASPHHHSRYSISGASSTPRRISVPVSRLNSGLTTPSLGGQRPSARGVSHAGSPALSSRAAASTANTRSSPTPVPPTPPATGGGSRIPLPAGNNGNSSRPSSRHSVRGPPAVSISRIPAPLALQTGGASFERGSRPSTPTARSSAGGGHNRTPSGASAAGMRRQPLSQEAVVESSPRLDAEARALAARRIATEREHGKRVDRLNRAVQDMIREASETLNSGVQVLGGDDAGIWEDEWE